MLGKGQSQDVDEGGTAIQAGRDVVVTTTGLSYSEVKEVALDVFRANYYVLAGVAKETAKARVEEITEEFFSKLRDENPAGFEKAEDPDFQHAVFSVQKEYARCGDKDLGALLVDLLVDRSKQQHRDILQIVLNESLATAPKLTESHLASLSIIFLLRYTASQGLANHAALGEYLDRMAQPFVQTMARNTAAYQHLQFCGCGSVELGSVSLEKLLRDTYPGLFQRGLETQQVDQTGLSYQPRSDLFIACLNDATKVQVKALNSNTLNDLLVSKAVSKDDSEHIRQLFKQQLLSEPDVRSKCIEIRPYMSEVFETWSASPMKQFTLTSVGIAIGHANIKKLVGEFADLSIWIN